MSYLEGRPPKRVGAKSVIRELVQVLAAAQAVQPPYRRTASAPCSMGCPISGPGAGSGGGGPPAARGKPERHARGVRSPARPLAVLVPDERGEAVGPARSS